ncbi:PfkB family carbohydrate kinase [Microbacterium sp. NPDC089189]|uniref:PfkB family carbohydrate kinase n=1 Tax=Microbacterium sp. NPDC089189 TaxID=3154972 RepID=UPI00342DB1CA
MHFPDNGVDVLVIGSVNIDTAFRIDRLPRPGETIAAADISERGGGKGANQVFAAAAHGGRAALLAAVGHDADIALQDLRAVGVDLSGLVTVEEPTGRAVLLLAGDENAIVVGEGANGHLTPAHVDAWAADHAAPAVVVLQHEVRQSVVLAAIERFSGSSRVFLNPSPWRDGQLDAVFAADVLVLNEIELAAAAGGDAREGDASDIASLLAGLPGGDVVVTMGADGALVREAGEITRIPAHRVDAVDTVGAGDAFLGTLAMAVARGARLVDAARDAAAAAAVVVTLAGARDTTALPAS